MEDPLRTDNKIKPDAPDRDTFFKRDWKSAFLLPGHICWLVEVDIDRPALLGLEYGKFTGKQIDLQFIAHDVMPRSEWSQHEGKLEHVGVRRFSVQIPG